MVQRYSSAVCLLIFFPCVTHIVTLEFFLPWLNTRLKTVFIHFGEFLPLALLRSLKAPPSCLPSVCAPTSASPPANSGFFFFFSATTPEIHQQATAFIPCCPSLLPLPPLPLGQGGPSACIVLPWRWPWLPLEARGERTLAQISILGKLVVGG